MSKEKTAVLLDAAREILALAPALTVDDWADYRIYEPARAFVSAARDIEVYAGRNRKERSDARLALAEEALMRARMIRTEAGADGLDAGDDAALLERLAMALS